MAASMPLNRPTASRITSPTLKLVRATIFITLLSLSFSTIPICTGLINAHIGVAFTTTSFRPTSFRPTSGTRRRDCSSSVYLPNLETTKSSRRYHHRYHLPNHQTTLSMTSSGAASTERGGGSKVIIVGSINQDLTVYAPSLPAPGQTLLGSNFVSGPGGKGANQAVAASCIGIVNANSNDGSGVHMIGRVGNDDMGRSLLNGLRSSGVQIGNANNSNKCEAVVSGMHTGVASIVVDSNTGQNTIVVVPGANLALSPSEVDSTLSRILDNGANSHGNTNNNEKDIVLVQLEIDPVAALQALQTASKLGALTILNPAPAPNGWELTNDWLSSIDILIPNETELAALCGVSLEESGVTGEGEEAMARSLLERGVRKAVIVTLGERGAMIVERHSTSETTSVSENRSAATTATVVPAWNEDGGDDEYNHRTTMIGIPTNLPCQSLPVIDTVGAGDAFCGALAAYLSRGVNVEFAASMACGVASMSVKKRGAQESYPRKEDLPDCLKLDDSLESTREDANDSNEQVLPNIDNKVEEKATITFVTGNKNKLAEVQRLLSTSADNETQQSSSLKFDIVNAKLDLPELQGSPQHIASEKCRAASEQLKTAVITEDTSLGFHALEGLPGPYIKWFLEDLGHDGLNKLLVGFEDDEGKKKDMAYAETIIAFCPGPGKDVILFEGRTEGRIVNARGSKDFGWDPIFEPLEEECLRGGIGNAWQKTYAEMEKYEKNLISHRGKAFHKFREYLINSSEEILKEMEG